MPETRRNNYMIIAVSIMDECKKLTETAMLSRKIPAGVHTSRGR